MHLEFLTDDLSFQDECDTQRKYLGVCRLPGENRLVKHNLI